MSSRRPTSSERAVSCRSRFSPTNTIAHQLDALGMTSGYSHSSVVHAVTEVIAAIFAEAEAIASAQEEGGACLELHSSTDAAWRGTAARGAGIAMNGAGRAVVVEASFKVASRLVDELSCSQTVREE
jgi:hypothetical protein